MMDRPPRGCRHPAPGARVAPGGLRPPTGSGAIIARRSLWAPLWHRHGQTFNGARRASPVSPGGARAASGDGEIVENLL